MTPEIQILRDPNQFRAIRNEWNDLVVDDPNRLAGHDALSTYEWFEASIESFPEGMSARVVTARENGALVGLLPVIRKMDSGLERRLLVSTELHGGRNGLLLRRQDPELLGAMISNLSGEFPDWRMLQLTLLKGEADETTLADCCRRYGYRSLGIGEQESPYFHIPTEHSALMSSYAKDVRSRVRSGTKKLEASGSISFFVVRGPEDVEEFISEMLAVETKSWKYTAGTSIANRPQQERFYRALLPKAAAAGMLRAIVLHLNGEPIAHSFGLVRCNVFCGLKISVAQKMNDLAPAHLLRHRQLHELIDLGIKTYDFMGRVEPHKLRWSNNNRSYLRRTHLLFNSSIAGRTYFEIKSLRQRLLS